MPTPLLSSDLMRKLDQIELLSRRRFAGRVRGEQHSTRKGHSLEFADYRTYIQGDDIRFIDWKIFARLDRLFLKLFMEEEDLFVYVLLDTSLSMGMGDPAKLAYAKQVAAALSYVSLACTHRVAIQPLSGEPTAPLPPTRGKAQFPAVARFLQSLEPTGSTDLRAGLAEFRARARAPGVAFLLSDLFDRHGTADAFKLLLAGGYEGVVLHILSPEDEDPDWTGDWKLVDIEDGGAVAVSMSAPLREAYARTVRQFRAEQRDLCARYGFPYVPVTSNVSIDSLLLHSLRARGIVR